MSEDINNVGELKEFMYMNIIKIVTNKVQKNWLLILIFILLGFILACLGFELDKESYSSIFITAAGTVASLIGFIGIFVVYKLQNIRDIRKYHINNISILKNELKIYGNNILIAKYKPDEINTQLIEIERIIGELDYEIEFRSRQIDPTSYRPEISYMTSDLHILNQIKYNLELILENIDLEKKIDPHKDSFLFAIYSIFLFTIALAFNNIHFLNDNYVIIFDHWRYVKMPFMGLLFGLFFIVLKDLARMLTKLFLEYS